MSQTALLSRLPDPIYLRMLGYSITLVVHILNLIYLHIFYGRLLQQDPDPDMVYFYKYKLRALTIWNVTAQLVYATLGLSHDLMLLSNGGKDTSLAKTLGNIRDLFFSTILFPVTWFVVVAFWTFYTYEPTLIFPASVANTFPWISNHVIHTFILLVALWEIAFRPRVTPVSHHLNLVVLFIYGISFAFAVFYTRYETGRFQYPIFTILYEYKTPFFYLLFLISYILQYGFYEMQWYLTEFLHGNGQKGQKIIQKIK